mgnify:CR=1 FL=1
MKNKLLLLITIIITLFIGINVEARQRIGICNYRDIEKDTYQNDLAISVYDNSTIKVTGDYSFSPSISIQSQKERLFESNECYKYVGVKNGFLANNTLYLRDRIEDIPDDANNIYEYYQNYDNMKAPSNYESSTSLECACPYDMLGLKFCAVYQEAPGNTGVKYIMQSDNDSGIAKGDLFDKDAIFIGNKKYNFSPYMYTTVAGHNYALQWSGGPSFNTTCPQLHYEDMTQNGDDYSVYMFSFNPSDLNTPGGVQHSSCDGEMEDYYCNNYSFTFYSCPTSMPDCTTQATIKFGMSKDGTKARIYYDGACSDLDLTKGSVTSSVSVDGIGHTVYVDSSVTANWKEGICPNLEVCDREGNSNSLDLIIQPQGSTCLNKEGTVRHDYTSELEGISAGEQAEYTCEGLIGENVLNFLTVVFHLIQIVGPIIALVLGMYDLFMAMVNGEDDAKKKALKKLKGRIIAAVLLLILPYVLDILLHFVNRDASNCIPH